jgi:hypothetical protein
MPLTVKHFLIGFVFVTGVLSLAQKDLDFYIANHRQPAIARVVREHVSLGTDLVMDSVVSLSQCIVKIGLLPHPVLTRVNDELTAQHYDVGLKLHAGAVAG